MKRWTAADAAWLAVLAASLLLVVPWQGALDRIGDAAAILPVPAARGYTKPALALLDAGAWWRVEPDYSLFLVRNIAFAERRPWHIVSAYGPWSFLFRGYHPRNYFPLVAIWAAIAMVTVLLLRRIGSIVLATAFLIVIAADPRPGLLLVFPLLVLVWRRAPSSAAEQPRAAAPTLIIAIVLMALMGLVKSSSLALGVIVAATMGIEEIRRRRAPLAPLIYAGSLLLFWFAAGQDATWIGGFLRGTWHVSSAYGEAEFSGSMSTITLLLLVVAAVAIAMVARRVAWTETAALILIALAFIKTSLVRDDPFHAALAPMAIMALVLLLAAGWPRAVVAIVAIASVLIIAPFLPPPREIARQIRAMSNPIAAKKISDALFARDMIAIRDRTPLPPIRGSVDVYGDRQSIVIAHALDYHPRPVWQSYIAYDRALAEMNAAHLRGSDAPDSVLFGMSITDERFPSLDDGLSWPDLLTRYRPVAAMPEMLLLERAANRGAARLVPRHVLRARLGDRIALPSDCGDLVWANIEVETTAAGKLLAMIYKVPEITLTVETAGGERLGGRLVRRSAAAGFLLSPVIVGPLDFGAVAAGQTSTLARRRVTALVVAGTGPYRPEVTIVLRELQIERPR